MPGPYSYIQYNQSINVPIIKKISDSFIKHEALLTYFPISTEDGQYKRGRRVIGGLPVPTWAAINGPSPTPFIQDYEDYDEEVYYIADNFDIDIRFLKDKNYIEGNPVEKQIDSYIEGRAFDLNDKFINNDHTKNPLAPVGIKYRTQNPQLFGNNPGVRILSTASLASNAFSASNSVKIQNNMRLMLDRMGAGKGDNVIGIMSPQVKRQIDSVVQSGGSVGGFKTTEDAFGRQVTKFDGVTLVSAGYAAPSQNGMQTTPVISDAQDQLGNSPGDVGYNPSGAIYSTIYFIRAGEGWFQTWQHTEPTMLKVTQVSGQRYQRIMFDMSFGIWNENTRAIGTIYGIPTDGPSNS